MFYDLHVFVCTNERPPDAKRGCCKSKGSEEILKTLRAKAKEAGVQKIRVNQAGCLDRCEQGPSIVVYPEGIWYGGVTMADLDEIVHEHFLGGKPVERLLQKKAEA